MITALFLLALFSAAVFGKPSPSPKSPPSSGPAGNYKAPATKFDLTNWKLQLPVEPQEVGQPALNKYASKYFYLSSDGAMTFMSITNGVHTANSQYERSELREMAPGGDWSISGNSAHVLKATLSVPSCATDNNKVTIGQIHTNSPNAELPIVVELQWTAGRVSAMYSTKDSPVHKYLSHIFGTVGASKFDYTILIQNKKMIITVTGFPALTVDVSGWGSTPQYFKAGDYVQSNTGAYQCTVKFYSLCTGHGKSSCTPGSVSAATDAMAITSSDGPTSTSFSDEGSPGWAVGLLVLGSIILVLLVALVVMVARR